MHIHLVAGKPIVYVPKNDVSSVPLRGAVAVLSEKFKPGTMSDGALLQGAYQAGADAVIKIGGGGLDSSEKRANQVVNRETQYCKHPSSQLLKLLGFMVHHPKYTALGDDSLGFTSFEVAMSRSSGFFCDFPRRCDALQRAWPLRDPLLCYFWRWWQEVVLSPRGANLSQICLDVAILAALCSPGEPKCQGQRAQSEWPKTEVASRTLELWKGLATFFRQGKTVFSVSHVESSIWKFKIIPEDVCGIYIICVILYKHNMSQYC